MRLLRVTRSHRATVVEQPPTGWQRPAAVPHTTLSPAPFRKRVWKLMARSAASQMQPSPTPRLRPAPSAQHDAPHRAIVGGRCFAISIESSPPASLLLPAFPLPTPGDSSTRPTTQASSRCWGRARAGHRDRWRCHSLSLRFACAWLHHRVPQGRPPYISAAAVTGDKTTPHPPPIASLPLRCRAGPTPAVLSAIWMIATADGGI